MNYTKSTIRKLTLGFFLAFSLFIISGCQKDDDEIEKANKAFYDLMKEWYLWYKQMPAVNPSNYSSPYYLLEALRVYPPDRWSFISTKTEFESYFKESKFIGFGFGSAYDTGGSLRISFIFNSVQLYQLGVRRGWIIKSVNGITLNGQSIGQLLGPNQIGVSATFVFRKPDGTEVSHTVTKQEVIMNNVLHKEVINTTAGNVGYLVFQGFTEPSIAELKLAFQEFTNAGITDLILDLRYNGGGSVGAAVFLGSSLLSAPHKDQVFVKYIHNDKKTSENTTNKFIQTEYNLNLTRLITIATSGTASASELIINGLKPYIPVYVVGDDTHGKPTGMYAWYYKDYAFVPVTFKTTNANDEGDFYDGIPANSYVADDTTRPFGDPEEASLKEALHFIVSGSFSGTIQTKKYMKQPWEEMTGLRAIIMSH